MEMYLRPKTLFGEKFDRYLNAEIRDREFHFNKPKYNMGQTYKKAFNNLGNCRALFRS